MTTSPVLKCIIRWVRKSKLSIRLIAAFLIISFLPSLVLALFSNRIYANSITGTTAASVKQSLQLLSNNANLVLSEYSNYLDKLSTAYDLQDFLYAKQHGIASGSTFTNANEALSFVSMPNLRSTVILDANGSMLINKGFVSFPMDILSAIMAETDQLSPKDYVSHCEATAGQDYIVMCRKIYDNRYTRIHMGYIMLFLDISALKDSILPTTSMGEGADIFIVNSAGQPVAFQSPDFFQIAGQIDDLLRQAVVPDRVNRYTAEIADRNNLVVYVYSSEYKLYMFSLVPYTTLYRDVNWVKSMILIVTVLLLIICLALSLLIYFSVITPINAAVAVCENVENGGTLSLIQDCGQDELALMSNSIDSMILHNRRSMIELEKNDQKKRELEIEMLKYQLNPHFLFNTLNTFKWIADINCLQNLRDGIASMADLLRNTLVQKQEFITLQAETDLLRNYCTIQNLRYAGQFEVTFTVDDEASQCLVPRFILQPLVENAITHGIRSKEEVLQINVSGHVTDGNLTVEVRDDGIGFDTAMVFDAENDQYIGIGHANVDNRLRLYYGSQNRLCIISDIGTGTICRMIIPAKTQQKETE